MAETLGHPAKKCGIERERTVATLGMQQEIARQLLRMYRERRAAAGGKFGARKLETEIYRAAGSSTSFVLSREDIYGWLVGRTKNLGPAKFQLIEKFILTEDFAKVVPRARAIYAALENTVRIGDAYSQVHGYGLRRDKSAGVSHLDGLWLVTGREKTCDGVGEEIYQRLTDRDRSYAYAFMYVRSIVGHEFSVAHFLRGRCPPSYLPGVRASGLLFSKDGDLRIKAWNRINRQESRHELRAQPATDSSSRHGNETNHDIQCLQIDFDPSDSPADRVLSTITPYHPLNYFLLETIPSKPPYFAYRCSELFDVAERASVLLDVWKRFDPTWISNLGYCMHHLSAVEKMFDSFVWSVIPDGITEET